MSGWMKWWDKTKMRWSRPSLGRAERVGWGMSGGGRIVERLKIVGAGSRVGVRRKCLEDKMSLSALWRWKSLANSFLNINLTFSSWHWWARVHFYHFVCSVSNNYLGCVLCFLKFEINYCTWQLRKHKYLMGTPNQQCGSSTVCSSYNCCACVVCTFFLFLWVSTG